MGGTSFGARRSDTCVILGATALLLAAIGTTATASERGTRVRTQSPGVVKQLAEAMTGRQLTAIAAPDPEAPGRFVAAMLFPGVQLLAIGARTDAVPYIDARLSARDYAAVYTALQNGVADSKFFVQDMGGDGLHGTADRLADLVYERGVDQHVLNGDYKAAKLSETAYATLVETLDKRYARIVTLLLDAARAVPAGPEAAR